MHHVYVVTGTAFYVLDIYHELVEKEDVHIIFITKFNHVLLKCVHLHGGLRPDPLTKGFFPWTPNPHYRLALRARHIIMAPAFQTPGPASVYIYKFLYSLFISYSINQSSFISYTWYTSRTNIVSNNIQNVTQKKNCSCDNVIDFH